MRTQCRQPEALETPPPLTAEDLATLEAAVAIVKRYGAPIVAPQSTGVLVCLKGRWKFADTLSEALCKLVEP